MKFKDLVKLYEEKRKIYGENVYRHISEVFEEAKKLHYADWLKHPTPNRDHEQSWRAFKGKNFEKLILYMIEKEVQNLGLKTVKGDTLERTKSENLPLELNKIKRSLLVDFGRFGCHLPDADIIIYEPKTCRVIAIISSKITLRERIAQTGYWKIKLSQDEVTKHVKVFFVTTDEDGDLVRKTPATKGRAIVETDTNGGYVMSKAKVEEDDKVKMFDKFIDDLKCLGNFRQ